MVTYAINGPILEITLQGSYTTKDIAALLICRESGYALAVADDIAVVGFQREPAHPIFCRHGRALCAHSRTGTAARYVGRLWRGTGKIGADLPNTSGEHQRSAD